MSESKNHEPYMIPARNSNKAYESGFNSNDYNTDHNETDYISFDAQLFAEIEIDNAMKTSLKSTPIPHPTHPIMDDKRRIFNSMRELSWSNHSFLYENSKFYNRQTQLENSRIFYKQAVFMKDFEDDFDEVFPFSAYFPYYQLMNYEQLRTYFTWRTKVRNGYVGNTSLSYVFVYIYELLNNIGVNDPVEGLNEIMSFWNTYKFYDTTFEKYLMKWIKDYHIYYRLPMSFQDFLYNNKLQYYYPEISQYDPDANFDFEYLSGISIYKIKQSSFYNDKTNQMINDCFNFVIQKLADNLKAVGIVFKDLIMQCSTTKSVWTPFRGALFYPTLKQPDRQVVFSDNEVYLCSQNTWFVSTISTTSSGRHLIGYILKQMEADLRKVTNYKHKLSANLDSANEEILQKFKAAGISIEKVITESVLEFYREKNKIVISVNRTNLDKIRLEALDTQEKLIIPESDTVLGKIRLQVQATQEKLITPKDDTNLDKIRLETSKTQERLILSEDHCTQSKIKSETLSTQEKLITPEDGTSLKKIIPETLDAQETLIFLEDNTVTTASISYKDKPLLSSGDIDRSESRLSPSDVTTLSDGWTRLKNALNDIEINALTALLQGNQNMKQYANNVGIMLEVLADNINEKAFDHIGDNILELDDSMMIYDEYREKIMIMVG